VRACATQEVQEFADHPQGRSSCAQVLEAAETATRPEQVFTHVSHALFRSKAVHDDFVDAVAWLGDALLTKSVRNEVLLWHAHGNLGDTMRLGLAPGASFQVRSQTLMQLLYTQAVKAMCG
jgi:hypothetical protein